MRICSKCGASSPDNYLYCEKCGSPLNQAPSQPAQPAPAPTPVRPASAYNNNYGNNPAVVNRNVAAPAPSTPKKSGNGPIIALISVLSVLIVAAAIVLIVVLAGKGKKEEVPTTAPTASQTVTTTAPTTAAPTTEAPTAAPVVIPDTSQYKTGVYRNGNSMEIVIKEKSKNTVTFALNVYSYEYSESFSTAVLAADGKAYFSNVDEGLHGYMYFEDGSLICNVTQWDYAPLATGVSSYYYYSSSLNDAYYYPSDNTNNYYENGSYADFYNNYYFNSVSIENDLGGESFLYGRDREEVQMMINTILARHGYIFQKEERNVFFSQFSWYQPRTASMDEAVSDFNYYEYQNYQFLAHYRDEHLPA